MRQHSRKGPLWGFGQLLHLAHPVILLVGLLVASWMSRQARKRSQEIRRLLGQLDSLLASSGVCTPEITRRKIGDEQHGLN